MLRLWSTALLALALGAPSMGGAATPPGERPAIKLSVAAAASLKPALDELSARFEEGHPGVEVAVTYGASGALVSQLKAGAPFDAFLSADREYPQALVRSGLARPEDEVVFAVGKLVLWLPKRLPLPTGPSPLSALAESKVRRVAIANPATAPYGRAALAALERAGLLEAVRGKLVLAQSVAQAAQFAQSGAADAALLPASLARLPALEGVGRALELPVSEYPRLEHSGVVLSAAKQAGAARELLSFLTGEEARAAWARRGYGLP